MASDEYDGEDVCDSDNDEIELTINSILSLDANPESAEQTVRMKKLSARSRIEDYIQHPHTRQFFYLLLSFGIFL